MRLRLAVIGAVVVASTVPLFAGTGNATVCGVATDTTVAAVTTDSLATLLCAIDTEG